MTSGTDMVLATMRFLPLPARDARPHASGSGLLLVLALVAGPVLPAPLAGQEDADAGAPPTTAALAGTITDAADGAPLEDVVVALPSRAVGTRTDAEGRYAFDGLPAGELTIEVRLDGSTAGSRTVTLRPGAVNRVDLSVRREAVEVPGLDVAVRDPIPRGKMAGFYLRREDGQGAFLTREEIQESNPTQMSDVFRRVAGVRLIRHPRRPGVFWLQMARAQATFTGEGATCRPAYFVDGRPFEAGDQGVNALFDPGNVAGLEVYRGASEVPARFNVPDARCGVVVVWTRDAGTEAWAAGGDS